MRRINCAATPKNCAVLPPRVALIDQLEIRLVTSAVGCSV
jgi:hypothetical protein